MYHERWRCTYGIATSVHIVKIQYTYGFQSINVDLLKGSTFYVKLLELTNQVSNFDLKWDQNVKLHDLFSIILTHSFVGLEIVWP